MATSISVTGNYHADLKSARALGIVTGISPKADQLYDLIDNYNIKQMSEFQDELINACKDSTEKGDLPLLPRPVLKRDRVSLPDPILKRDRVVKPDPILKRDRVVTVDPLKRPISKPIKLSDRKVTIASKPKLGNRFNRNLFQ
jgi:hypothetical protein